MRLLELPNGRDIAVEMYRELLPYLWQLSPLAERDPSGAVGCLLGYAEGIGGRLGCSQLEPVPAGRVPSTSGAGRVA